MGAFDFMIAVRESALSATQRHVLNAMALRADRGGECWAAVATLAEDCGLTDRTVRAAIRVLEAHKVTVPTTRPGRTTVWKLDGSKIPVRLAPNETPETASGGAEGGSGVGRKDDPPRAETASGGAETISADQYPSLSTEQSTDPPPNPPPSGGGQDEQPELAPRAARIAELAEHDLDATPLEHARTVALTWLNPSSATVGGLFARLRGTPRAPAGLRQRDVEQGVAEAARRWLARQRDAPDPAGVIDVAVPA